jgi:hypothetical protein
VYVSFDMSTIDAGADAGVFIISDPLGTPSVGGAFQTPSPGVLVYAGSTLFMGAGSPPDLRNYPPGGGAALNTGIVFDNQPFRGLAYDPTSKLVFVPMNVPPVGDAGPSIVRVSTQTNPPSQQFPDIVLGAGNFPGYMTYAPWGELITTNSGFNSIDRYLSDGTRKGSVSFTPSFSPGAPIAAFRFNGVDEIFVSDVESGAVNRCVFTDLSHATAVCSVAVVPPFAQHFAALFIGP